MKQGKIVKGIAGFYYVHVVGSGIYECKAKGIFRNRNIKPLVGDDVSMEVISEEEKTGNITDVLERKNALIRPAVANVDQALIIFAVVSPDPNLNLLDRFLIMMEQQEVPVIICFNKDDLGEASEIAKLKQVYENTGYQVLFFSAKQQTGIDRVRQVLKDKTTTVAGPSGVGKSTLINLLAPHACMETGEISRKIGRGKNTTRHSELIMLEEGTYIFDTPGFSSLSVDYYDAKLQQTPGGFVPVEKENLAFLFPEMAELAGQCRFTGCSHTHEPGCAVKEALEAGQISKSRYTNYVQIYNELKDKKKY